MLKPTEVKAGVAYDYPDGDDPKMGVVLEVASGLVKLDNGDEIPFKRFMDIASISKGIIETEQEEVNPGNQNQNNNANDLVVSPSQFEQNIKYDKNGNPELPTNAEGGKNDIKDRPIIKKQVVIADPLTELIKKAKKESQKLELPCDIPIINKGMFDILVDTYGEESKGKIIGILVDSFNSNDLKELLKTELNKHYGLDK